MIDSVDYRSLISSFVDKVFGPGSTEAVYEEGVRNVALSSLMGINGSDYRSNHVMFFHLNLYSH